MKITPAKKRLLAYSAIIGGCALLAVVFFTTSQFQRAKYSSSKALVEGANKELNKLAAEQEALDADTSISAIDRAVKQGQINDGVKWQTLIKENFTKETDKNSKAYKGTAIPAYTFSLLALVGFGFCLKFEDKAKEKEENDQ